MKNFPRPLVTIAGIGMGFFSFVVATGILMTLFGKISSSLLMMLLIIVIGIASGYFGAKYARRFMIKHVARGAHDGSSESSRSSKRIGAAIFFSGFLFFGVFIFIFLSSIINLYV